MSKIDLNTLADKVEGDDKAQTAFQAKYPGGRLERTTFGIQQEDIDRGYTYLTPRFNSSAEAADSWERMCAANDTLRAGQSHKEEELIAAAIGKPESPAAIEAKQQDARKRKRLPKSMRQDQDLSKASTFIGGVIKV